MGILGAFLVECQLPPAALPAHNLSPTSFLLPSAWRGQPFQWHHRNHTGTLSAFGNVDGLSRSSAGKGHKLPL